MRSRPSSWQTVLAKLGFRRVRRSRATRSSGRFTRVERLEPRHMMAGDSREYVITTLMDDDVIGTTTDEQWSLREALAHSAIDAGTETDVIRFDPALFNDPETLDLDSSLGSLTIGSNVDVVGPGAHLLSIDANSATRVLFVAAGFETTISGLTVTGGYATTPGAGILNWGDLTLDSVRVTGNTSTSNGGGVNTQNGTSGVASLHVLNSTIDNNSAMSGSGINANVGGELIIIGSTISNNHGYNLQNQAYSAGGGIAIAGSSSGTVLIANSTFSGNSALYSGGVRFHNNQAPTIIVNSTIAYNTGNESGGLQRLATSTPVTLHNTIVAENKNHSNVDKDVLGTLNSISSFNLIGRGGAGGLTDNDANHNLVLTSVESAGLIPLGDYGGQTKTHGLQPNSQAVDRGNDAINWTLDQRGFTRVDAPGGGSSTSDIGAFEYRPSLEVNTTKDLAVAVGELSLRQALNLAGVEDDQNEITFAPALYASGLATITLQYDGTDANSTPDTLVAWNVDIVGPGADKLSISGANATSVITGTGQTSIEGVTVKDGNSATSGGGVNFVGGGYFTIRSARITGNQAVNRGGGVYAEGSLQIFDSEISNNVVTSATGTGAGVHYEEFLSYGPFEIVNSTISGNDATGTSSQAGGVFARRYYSYGSAIDILNSTITNNSAASGGGLYSAGNAIVSLKNSIVVDNTTTDGTTASNIAGANLDSGSSHNLVGTGGTGGLNPAQSNLVNKTVTEAALSPLGFYGGVTQTHAPLPNSLAIDHGSDSIATGAGLTGDQRGGSYYRKTGNSVDAGAAEANVIQRSNGSIEIHGTALDDNIIAYSDGVSLGVFIEAIGLQMYQIDPLNLQAILYRGYAGNDSINSELPAALVTLRGDEGNDFLYAGESSHEIHGGDGNDNIQGSNVADLIFGGLGEDFIQAFAGEDEIYGDDGNDRIYGGQDDDLIFGGEGDDLLVGGVGIVFPVVDGNDVIYGEGGNDDIDGGEGNDTLSGGEGNDVLRGKAGDDVLAGDLGTDVLYPAAGLDNPEEVKLTGSASIDEGSTYQLTLDWTGVSSSISGVTINWGDGSTATFVAFGTTLAQHIYAADSVGQPNFRYAITGTMVAGGDSIVTETAGLLVLSDDPVAPVGVTASGSYDLTLSWTNMTNQPTSFEIQVSRNGLDNWSTYTTVGGHLSQLYVNDAQEHYYYRLRTIKSGTPSDWSTAVLFARDQGVVRASAAVTGTSQPEVTLSWPDELRLQNTLAGTTYTVYRKIASESSWGSPIAVKSATEIGNSYVDDDVSSGNFYEYKIERSGTAGFATGYIAAAVRTAASVHENRGTILLVVDDQFEVSLAFEIARLKSDLIGDGWHVEFHYVDVAPVDGQGNDVPEKDVIAGIKAEIIDVYENTSIPSLKSVMLLGHIPTPRSGWQAPDGHNPRPLPADVYYGDVDGEWSDSELNYSTYIPGVNQSYYHTGNTNVPGDGIFDDQDVPPDGDGAAVELSVGRIDMHNLTKFDPSSQYTADGQWQHYKINVGESFTGHFDKLAFASGENVPSTFIIGSAEFKDIKIYEAGTTGTAINFSSYDNSDFLPAREQTGDGHWGYDGFVEASSVTVTGPTAIKFDGSAWRVIDVFGNGITITPNTILEFDFRSQGTNGQADLSRVVAIGFDKDGAAFNGRQIVSEDAMFRVHAHSGVGWGRPIDASLETDLLRRYLNKDHAFRHGQFDVQRRALIDDSLQGGAPSRYMTPLVGSENVYAQQDTSRNWKDELQTNSYLWAYGGATGSYWGSGDNLNDVLSSDFLSKNPSLAVFTEQFSSFSLEHHFTDNLLRSILANEGYGLTATWGNWGDFSYYHMGAGGTIGASNLVTQNRGVEFGQFDGQAEVYTALLGDPTLRMHSVKPVSNVVSSYNGSEVDLTWTPSPEDSANGGTVEFGGSFVGYHVYRAASLSGPFVRVNVDNQELFTGTALLIPDGHSNDIYMVRAVKLENVASGSYYNLSQGVFSQELLQRWAINVGGDQVSGPGGAFSEDLTSGTDISTSATIDLTQFVSVPIGTPQSVFQTAKVGATSWNFGGVEGAQFVVRLYFAEIQSNNFGVGQRIFDVDIQGSTVLDDYDIFANVGANTGVVKSFVATADEFGLNIQLSALVGSPLISAIEVFQLDPEAV